LRTDIHGSRATPAGHYSGSDSSLTTRIVTFATDTGQNAMDTLAPVDTTGSLREPVSPAVAYLLDADSEGVVRRCFTDLGFVDGRIARGSIDSATE